MNIINSLQDGKHFILNGIEYFRNYVSAVHGSKIELYNCYERKDVLIPLTHYSEFMVNGSTFASASELQAELLDVTYSRLTVGDSTSVDQNNEVKIISLGSIVIPASGYLPLPLNTTMVNKLNQIPITVTAKQTPVIVTVKLQSVPGILTYTSKLLKYLFKPGKGNWGLDGTPVTTAHLELISTENYLVQDLLNEPNAIIENLGTVPDGDFVTAANERLWDFADSDTPTEVGIKTYFFSYETDGVLYFAQFVGTPGIYGDMTGNHFSIDDFISSTDSRVTEIPNLEQILAEGGNINVSQLTNDGDGSSPYTTEVSLNGISISVNQAAAEMYLKNSNGITLSTINLGFLNNEGTAFFYNESTGKLQLKNDTGIILSEIPVSAFVSNLIQSVEFNGALPSKLEFKDAVGNIVESVNITISNVDGLQAALNTKANASGSNAYGTWPININGNAVTTINWGGSAADLSADSSNLSKIVGLDSVNTAKRYTAATIKSWLNLGISDVSGLSSAFTNKANVDGSNASGTWPNIVAGNSNGLGGYTYVDAFAPNDIQYFTVRDSQGQFRPATTGQAINALGIPSKANDSDVLHKIGNETKDGSLTLSGNLLSNSVFASGRGVFGTADINNDGTGGAVFNGNVTIDSNLLKITATLNPALQLISKPGGNFPLIQLVDNQRAGGSDWNIENGRQLGNLSFYSSAGQQMTLTKNGFLGLGPNSNNPISNFEVSIGTNTKLGFSQAIPNRAAITSYTDDGTQNQGLDLYGKDVTIRIRGLGTVIQASESGNVGIGIISPTQKLEVNGNIKLNSILTTDDSTLKLLAGNGAYRTELGGVGGYTQLNIIGPSSGSDVNFYGGNTRFGNIAAGGDGGDGTIGDLYLRTFNAGVPSNDIIIKGSTKNIGIGTTTPIAKLDVNGGINLQSSNSITWGGSYSLGVPTLAAGEGGFYFYPKGNVGGEKMRITTGGNVGIGTTTPLYKLDVKGSAIFGSGTVNGGNTAVVISNDAGTGKQWSLSSGIPTVLESSFSIINVTDNLTALSITADGKVGIGTSVANYMLSVAGTGKFDDELLIPKGTTPSSAVNKEQMELSIKNHFNSMFIVDRSYTGSSQWFTTLNTKYPDAKKYFRVIAIASGGFFAECILTEEGGPGIGKWLIISNGSGGEITAN